MENFKGLFFFFAVSRTFSVKEDGTETPCSSTEAEAVRPSDATVRELNADLDAGQKVQVLDVRGLEEDGERNLQLFENIVNMISRRHLAYTRAFNDITQTRMP